MAFKNFNNKKEFMEIIYSVTDTISFKLDDSFIQTLSGFGFIYKNNTHEFILAEENELISLAILEDPCHHHTGNTEHDFYFYVKRFYKNDKSKKLHRYEGPAFTNYWINGKIISSSYLEDGITINSIGKYNLIERMINGNLSFKFPRAEYFISDYTKTTFDSSNIENYFFNYNRTRVNLSAIQEIVPRINDLSHDDIVNLNLFDYLTNEEKNILDILFLE